LLVRASSQKSLSPRSRHRRRPNDPNWPKIEDWEGLASSVGGRLIRVQSPLNDCLVGPGNANCDRLFSEKTDRRLVIQMLFQGIDRDAAKATWCGFFQAIETAPDEFSFASKPFIIDFPARHFWDPDFLSRMPGATKRDDRAGSAPGNLYWSGDAVHH
jgi:hypothetical protein